jgi:hypothetical protein
MAADALRGFLGVGFLVGGCGLIMAFLQPPDSPQFILSLCSAGMGIALVIGVILVTRLLKSRDPS